jgi:hypothetical protein
MEYSMGKKIVGAKSDSKGKTTSVLLEGNSTFTPIQTAVRMAEKGQIEGAHAVHPQTRDPYIRSNPDNSTNNNIDNLCGDK